MYAGHLGFALGAYSFRRTTPLWLLLIASQIPDWLDAGMCIVDADRGPFGVYTHGVYIVGALAIGLALVYMITTRDGIGGLMVGTVVASHYGLDYLTGYKPTWPGGPIIGLGVYDRPLVDLAVEGMVILIGWWLYRRTLPRILRNDGVVYAVLCSLLTFQVIAGVAFFLRVGGQMKC